MIYKIIEDKKFEYKTITINWYDLTHNQINAACNGEEGWEMVNMFLASNGKDENQYVAIMKRAYTEKKVDE